MIKVEQIRNFVSGNFTNAVLSGKMKNGKIDLNLKLDSADLSGEYMHFYNVDLEAIRKQPEELMNYLIEKYLNNNTIVGVQYFVDIQYHQDKHGFVISGFNNTLKIALTKECFELLPKDFVKKIEFAKKKGIIKILNNIDVKQFHLRNFDRRNYGKYSTGLRIDSFIDGLVHYDGLKILDNDKNVVIYQEEVEFVKLIFSILMEKGNVDIESLKMTRDTLRAGYFNSMISYKMNDKVSFTPNSNGDLSVYKEFLCDYLKEYKDEVKDNQMKLVLSRKEW